MRAAEAFLAARAEEDRARETLRACAASLAATVARFGVGSPEADWSLADWHEALAAAEDAEAERVEAARAVLAEPLRAVAS